jgi:hypothetical protein
MTDPLTNPSTPDLDAAAHCLRGVAISGSLTALQAFSACSVLLNRCAVLRDMIKPLGFLLRNALTLRNFLSITSAHGNFERSYRGGKAHGQDGVTIRR